MKILAIGNSFSQDATRYLYSIARADGVSLKVVNLYIGGCSLYRHYRNMLSEGDAYSYEINGMSSGLYVSLKKALLSDEWDVVTLQQRSAESFKEESYEPYLSRLAEYVRLHAPKAKLYIHKTWAYENGCKRLEAIGAESAEQMLADLTRCYERAAERIHADGIIRSGDAMYRLHAELMKEEKSAFRDTYHASLGLGRYLLGLMWYGTLCDGNIADNTFRDLDKPVSETHIALAKKIALEALEAGK